MELGPIRRKGIALLLVIGLVGIVASIVMLANSNFFNNRYEVKILKASHMVKPDYDKFVFNEDGIKNYCI